MATPRSSADYYRRQQRLLVLLMVGLRHAWRRLDPTAVWSEQYDQDGIGRQLTRLVAAAQMAAVRDADAYLGQVVAELGLSSAPGGRLLAPAAYAGVAGDGRPVHTLLARAVPAAGRRYNQLVAQRRPLDLVRATDLEAARGDVERARIAVEEIDPDDSDDSDEPRDPRAGAARDAAEEELRLAEQAVEDLERADLGTEEGMARLALSDAERWLLGAAATAVIDIARAAESAGTTARDVGGYVRMLNPPSCSRCAVLAGAFYRWNDGFERHPGCDCRHIPATEAIAGDLSVDPAAYFDSLPTAADLDAQHPGMTVKARRAAGLVSQEDVFTQAGARAIRDGANIGQVVNARRGMRTAQVFGRDVQITTEGTTRRGLAHKRMRSARAHRGTTPVRLMPESIYQAAADRDDAVRLLRLHGYIL